ncbi:unnamed protein product [Caretta caretta]
MGEALLFTPPFLIWLLDLIACLILVFFLMEVGVLFVHSTVEAGKIFFAHLLPVTFLFLIYLVPAMFLLFCLQGLGSSFLRLLDDLQSVV